MTLLRSLRRRPRCDALALALAALPASLAAAQAPAPAPAPAAAPAPASPRGSDVWIADLRRDGGTVSIGRPRRVTNADGYHNQPVFTSDGRALLYSAAPRASGVPQDIYRYDVATRAVVRLTSTPESEYSPAPAPGGAQFTVLRVEADSAQRLWRLDGEGLLVTPVLPRERRVAYYAWADTSRMVLALLDTGGLSLHVADAGTGVLTRVAHRVGRSIQKRPGGSSVTFVQHESAGGAPWLVELDPYSLRTTRLARLPEGADHHAWLPDGVVLVGMPRGLVMAVPGVGATAVAWRPVAMAGSASAGAITRVTVSPKGDRVAWVGERE